MKRTLLAMSVLQLVSATAFAQQPTGPNAYALIIVECATCTTVKVHSKYDDVPSCVKARDELRKTMKEAHLIECVKGQPGTDL